MPSPAPVDSVLHAIGHTPVLRLRKIVPPGSADVVVKLEYFNPTGSYKDRMALAMIEGAEKRGTLRKGMRVVEYTGGSTGSSLAMVCAIKGYEFHPLSSDAFSKEKLDTMRAFGADLEIIQSDGGKVTPALFDKFKARIAELMKDPNTFWTDQFNNADALDGYANIGRELVEQIGHVDAYVGAVGSAGMLVGVSRALKAAPAARPASSRSSRRQSPFLTTGKGGAHRVEGTAAGFWPPHLVKGHVRRSARDRRERRPRHGAARSRRKKACSRARRAASTSSPRSRSRANWARARSWRPSRSIRASNTSPAISTNSQRCCIFRRAASRSNFTPSR